MKYKLVATTQFRRDLEEVILSFEKDFIGEDAIKKYNDTILSAILDRLENPKAYAAFYPYEGSDEYYSLDAQNCTIYYVVYDDIMELRRITMMSWRFADV